MNEKYSLGIYILVNFFKCVFFKIYKKQTNNLQNINKNSIKFKNYSRIIFLAVSIKAFTKLSVFFFFRHTR